MSTNFPMRVIHGSRLLSALVWMILANKYAKAFLPPSIGMPVGATHATTPFSSNSHLAEHRKVALSAIRAEGHVEYEVPQRRPLKTPVETFATLVECLDAMDNHFADGDPGMENQRGSEYTVVLFFAHYCKLCHQANIPYKRMAYLADPQFIRFTRLETSVMTTSQFRMLGISRVPFVQIYRHGVCVASFNTKWQLENKLKETLQICHARTVADWSLFMRQYEKEIQDNKAARRRLRQESLMEKSTAFSESGAIHTLASESQFLDAIDQSVNQPTLVMFHSHFEPACVRAQHQYRRIAGSPVVQGVAMTRIETSALSESFLQGLGVERFPHIQIYKDRMCVASFSVPQTYLFRSLVTNSAEKVKARSSEQWEAFYDDFQSEIDEKQRALETIRNGQLRA